jgi:tRNA-splicing ligase RtcB
MRIIDGIPVFGEPDPGALQQIKVCARTAAHVALMADNHKGYSVPIGGVTAYRDAVSISGVGYDIGCGNKAVLTNVNGTELRQYIREIMDDVWSFIAFGIGRKNDEKVDHALFQDDRWTVNPYIMSLKQMAQSQLGTVGSGNHYVDLFTDELDRVWIGVHFGSRGLGHKTASYFLEKAGAKDGMDVEPAVLSVETDLGDDYITAMELAGMYAYAGRDWVCERVAKILGAKILDSVHNHHNFAWREKHNGEHLWVVRKGATPAFPGQKGFVGGSMGEQSVILEGVGNLGGDWQFGPKAQQQMAMFSTVHGAGRVMGRMEAKGKYKNGVCVREPKVSADRWKNVWMKDIELRGGGLDESPDCYKRLPEVLAEQGDTIRVLHRLTPVGVAMAGKDEYDPYKD